MSNKDNQIDAGLEAQDSIMEDEGTLQPETWQGELPPEDDFHDQDEFQDDLQEEIVEEAMASEAYDDQVPVAADQGKRGKMVLFVVLGLGLAFAGGLAYLQFGGSGGDESLSPLVPISSILDSQDMTSASNAPPMNSESAPVADAQAPSSGAIDNKTSATVFADEARPLPGKEVQADLNAVKPPMHVQTDVISNAMPLPPASALPPVSEKKKPDAAIVPPPSLEIDSQVAKVENIPLPSPLKDAKESVTSAAASQEADRKIKDLTTQIETLKKSLDEVTHKNETLLGEVENLRKEAVKAKEAARSPLATAPVIKPVKEVKDVVVTDAATVVSPSTNVDEVKAPKTEVVKETKTVSKTRERAVKKSVPKKEVTKKASWVLRAATPGTAWVAVDAQSTELRRVTVGEALKGIGTVKEIRQKDGVWEVVGSSGSLK